MVSVKNEINEVLLNTVKDLETRLNDSRTILNDIQSKMDSKVSEAKEYKVSVDEAKENIKKLEEEIKSLENDLVELKDKYGKKNLVAVIEAGTKEINLEIMKKQDAIQVHKNKIAELTNRARSIKDLLLNLKKDKKIKEERLKELENCTKYYKVRLEEVVSYSDEHEDLNDYFETFDNESVSNSVNVFEDIVNMDDSIENIESEVKENSEIAFDEVSIAEADEVFNDVINPSEDDEDLVYEDVLKEDQKEIIEITEEDQESNYLVYEETDDEAENSEIENTRDLQINDLLASVKEPLEENNTKDSKDDKINNINKAIDEEFVNIFGKSINEPVKTMDIFGNEFTENINETDIVNKFTNLGLDYYAFTESDREKINENYNEQTISDIVKVLKDNKIQLDNIYVDANILLTIAPAELSNIIVKLLNSGQSAEAIGYVLDKLPLVDAKLLDVTINNYGEYIKNVDIVDIIIKSLKGDN